jgi:hypothetical protein
VTSSTASQLQFVATPSTSLASQTVTVRLRVLGNDRKPVKSGTLVTLKIVQGHHSKTVRSKTNGQGVVTFTGLKLAAGHYTLEATALGLKKPLTRSLTVLPG